jgi:hypothetical protein
MVRTLQVIGGWTAAALVLLVLLATSGPLAVAAAKGGRPAAENSAAGPSPSQPAKVLAGVYIQDIHELDYRSNSYVADLYVWFRWTDKTLDPVKSVEFMNVFDPQSLQKTVLYAEPKAMPDGSLYNVIRFQSRFSKKFYFAAYPFDRQSLDFIMEDTTSTASQLVLEPDRDYMIANPGLSLPGFRVGTPLITAQDYVYPTTFGDLSLAANEPYSRLTFAFPISRPVATLAVKTFVPILLIVVCAALVFYIHPHFVDGRIGLAITALLTLVALQFTAASSLPDADYFTMLDKVYMLSYAFIIGALMRVAYSSWHHADAKQNGLPELIAADRRWGWGLLAIATVLAALVVGPVILE